ncbi:MAG: cysteine desulfurase [Lachnospiraceae bacterium]|nr:cysteine desulfurase [Lachnospiraceae bacterium]
MEVYLDNSATTRCFDSAARLMAEILCKDYGNPSSMHTLGVEAEHHLRYAREVIAKHLKITEKEILFTSGGTESDNLALVGTAMANCRAGNHLITTRIEHPAILRTMEYLETKGFEVTYLPVDSCGRICLEELRNAMRRETILVSIMHTNNEIGALQPIEEAAALIKSCNPGTLFHVDAVQGFGKFRIHPKKIGIDLMSVSGHKLHGPKGVGFLYMRNGVKIQPILFGGGQQRGLRSGTENVPAIAGMAKAIEEVSATLEKDVEKMYGLKEYYIREITRLPEVYVNGLTGYDSAPHIISLAVAGVRSEVLLHALEERGIYVSAGSACAARKAAHSETLKAMGLRKELIEATVRISMSALNTEEEIYYTLQEMYDIIPMLRRYTRR